MNIIDSVKIAAAIGLLMQQTSAISCPNSLSSNMTAPANFVKPQDSDVDEAISIIDGLRKLLEEAYWNLSSSDEHAMYAVIGLLNPAKVDLCEIQLRSLEATLKDALQEVARVQRDDFKPLLIIVAKARSAASNLGHLIQQMTKPTEQFKSKTDLTGLAKLADHGTSIIFH